MKAHFTPTNPKGIEYTLEVTMTLEKWKELRQQIDSLEAPTYSPAKRLSSVILDVVFHANKHWYPGADDE